MLPYDPFNRPRSRDLRNHSTFGEITLWQHLKSRQLRGYQYYRQKPLDWYIADFYCPALKLIIELDGAYHQAAEIQAKDQRKEKILNAMGLEILRFTEKETQLDVASVLLQLHAWINDYERTHPDVVEKNVRKMRRSG